MPVSRAILVVVLLCAAVYTLACGAAPPQEAPSTSPVPVTAESEVAPEVPPAPTEVTRDPTRGTIKGRVHLNGAAPANPVIRMGADPVCAALNRRTGMLPVQRTVSIDGDGGLADVFVSLEGSFPSAIPDEPVTIVQRNCVYLPRVIGAQVGQAVRIVNQDTTLHNLHSLSVQNPFNVTQPRSGMVFDYTLTSPDVMLRLTCDAHSWMRGFVGVVAHPYFAVSGDDGTFVIANVPAGRQTIRTWHERFGEQTHTVTVTAGATADLDFSYDPGNRPVTAAPAEPVLVPSQPLERHVHITE